MLARHSLVWLSAGGWQRAAGSIAPDWRSSLERWQLSGWPAVLRRREAEILQDQLCLGLALPPDASGFKTRIPFTAQLGDILRIEEPLALQQALAHAPPAWSKPLHAFARDCQDSGIEMRIYGSWAWQILTRQSYVGAGSDIDLLFTPRNVPELSRGIALLARYAAHLPLDGEIVFPEGQGVAWKECWQALHAASQPRVLVKTEAAVRLTPLSALMSALEAA